MSYSHSRSRQALAMGVCIALASTGALGSDALAKGKGKVPKKSPPSLGLTPARNRLSSVPRSVPKSSPRSAYRPARYHSGITPGYP